MLRIAILSLIIIMVGMAIFLPKFRRTLGIVFVALMVVIGFIIWQDIQERKLEFQRVPLDQAQLSHMAVRPGLNTRSFVVTGRLLNQNPIFTIKSLTLQITIEDCQARKCEVVGQEEMDITVEVPSNQARDFSLTIPFPTKPKISGHPRWRYKVVQVRAH